MKHIGGFVFTFIRARLDSLSVVCVASCVVLVSVLIRAGSAVETLLSLLSPLLILPTLPWLIFPSTIPGGKLPSSAT